MNNNEEIQSDILRDKIIEGIWQATAYWTGDSSLYFWKEQEFKIIEEVWPSLFFIFRGGGSYFFNSFVFLLLSEL